MVDSPQLHEAITTGRSKKICILFTGGTGMEPNLETGLWRPFPGS